MIAQQKGDTLVPWASTYDEDYTVFLSSNESVTAEELFVVAKLCSMPGCARARMPAFAKSPYTRAERDSQTAQHSQHLPALTPRHAQLSPHRPPHVASPLLCL